MAEVWFWDKIWKSVLINSAQKVWQLFQIVIILIILIPLRSIAFGFHIIKIME